MNLELVNRKAFLSFCGVVVIALAIFFELGTGSTGTNVSIAAGSMASFFLFLTGAVLRPTSKTKEELTRKNSLLNQKVVDQAYEVAQQEEIFKALIENCGDGMMLLNDHGKIQYQSPAMERISGYKAEEAKGLHVFRSVHTGDMERAKVFLTEVQAEPNAVKQIELRMLHKDGHVVWLRLTVTNKLEDASLNSIVLNAHDITNKVAAQTKLQETTHELKVLFDRVEDALYSMDIVNRQYINLSKAHEKIYGRPNAEFLANTCLWYDLIHPEDKAHVDRNQEYLFKGQSVSLQFRIYRKDEVRWLESKVVPTLDENYNLVRVDGIVRDVTDKKRAEAEILALNSSLEQKVKERTQELEAINKDLESFSYSVSHDLRSPLRLISSFGKMLQKDTEASMDATGKEYLKIMMGSANQMSNLIDDLLAFARSGRKALSKEDINMGELAKGVIAELQKQNAGNVEIKVADLKNAEGDAALVRQVWVNLISNAIKYSSKKEKAVVEIGCNNSVYYVKDNGAGFDMERAAKLFGVFQRLHAASEFEGTGIGLALTDRIVTRHGGKIWAEAKVGEGATFYFTLS